ncbi:hypothetical protein HYQ45_011341 [Verticillium longisporum]|uniref:Peptide N-acetyl-beta-D-glucosaminyl asparaginase amidase A N-terminal domain-containing protein n=1 Tax=Verticillium longisporum TaxID=100787 RepID=A0A8I3AQ25_VERLO|nr:hypothetical protein HYQ45_011341 [Verticillium longisporum]PNH37035.1 hypothetical protein VD0004_g9736 [Verticillium dahliae]PNH60885.1 hypothetical protein VD0001_g9798 [Verticillium dahliae]RBQ66764.1 hypothetical protein VDGD_08620 [Verticillium dahliae]
MLLLRGWIIVAALAVPGLSLHPEVFALSRQASNDSQKPISHASQSLNGNSQPLQCFQVAQPVLGPTGPVYQADNEPGFDAVRSKDSCVVQLMSHSFGFSYGKPFVGHYTPPPACEFDRVIMNFTVSSSGRQFDRLALMFLNDTEVWRTSTAEPKPTPGIVWTYWKDMTEFLALWRSPQTIIFELGNLVDETYTGSFNCTLTATFFKSQVTRQHQGGTPADMIIPISAKNGASGKGSAWSLPSEQAVSTIYFPQHANRAVFSLSANGQMAEEFWWSNVLQSDVDTFNDTASSMPGLSPFREVQLYIDDQLAGVQWPFPVVFTGGVSPALHRPIVGLEAFDLREHEIDVSAWLPVLCDGQSHTFQIRVVGIDDDTAPASLSDKIDAYWVVTGKIFVWLDEPGSVTTGAAPKVDVPEPLLLISHQRQQDGHGVNELLDYSLRVRRAVSVTGEVRTQKGTYQAWWHQELTYSNLGHVSSFGTNQINRMTISGADEASGPRQYAKEYSYPLYANTSFSIGSDKSLTIEAELEQGLRLKTWGHAIFASGLEAFGAVSQDGNQPLGCKLETLRTGKAGFHQSGDRRRSSGSGWTRQDFYFGGIDSGSKDDVALYVRNVMAINDTVVSDREVSSRQGDSSGERTILRNDGKPATPSNSRQNAGQFAPPKGKHTLWGSWGESGHVVGLDEW